VSEVTPVGGGVIDPCTYKPAKSFAKIPTKHQSYTKIEIKI
jgi:hypothetical protein